MNAIDVGAAVSRFVTHVEIDHVTQWLLRVNFGSRFTFLDCINSTTHYFSGCDVIRIIAAVAPEIIHSPFDLPESEIISTPYSFSDFGRASGGCVISDESIQEVSEKVMDIFNNTVYSCGG
ncbi:MAG: hypothetical protein AAGG81_02120 [Chlamydiota bacterium]